MTEGVGAERISYVSELHRILAYQGVPSSLERVRKAETLGGFPSNLWNWVVSIEPAIWPNFQSDTPGVRLLNFSVEGTTIDYDLALLPQLRNLRPDAVFVFRGVVEAVHRMPTDAILTRCLPKRWSAMGGLEPRCYFSSHWLRGFKQRTESSLKSWLRRKIMSVHGSKPIMSLEEFARKFEILLSDLKHAYGAPVIVGPLLPVIGRHFPCTAEEFANFNEIIERTAKAQEAILLDWNREFPPGVALEEFYFADGLHLNAKGSTILAEALLKKLEAKTTLRPETMVSTSKTRVP